MTRYLNDEAKECHKRKLQNGISECNDKIDYFSRCLKTKRLTEKYCKSKINFWIEHKNMLTQYLGRIN